MKTISEPGKISIFRAEFEKAIIPKIAGKRGLILEIGCSTAMYRYIYNEMYIGLDLHSKEFPESDKDHCFIVGNGYNLPFKSGCFDFVFCGAILEHTEYPEKIIKEIYRVLKGNGKTFIGVPTHIGMIYEGHPKFRGFNYGELKKILYKNNFKIIWKIKIGGPIAHYVSLTELFTRKFILKSDHKFNSPTRQWSPMIQINSPLLRFRGFIIDKISTFELKTGLCNVYSQGLHILAKKSNEVNT